MRCATSIFTVFVSLLACNTATDPDGDGSIEDLPTVTEPLLPGDTVRFDLSEQTIPAGADVVLCHFFEITTEEQYVTAFESHQGKHGHHLIIFKARFAEEPGTVRDCTSPQDMIKFTPVISSVQFGLEQFPEGMAIRVPRGSQIVIQQHYVNSTTRPLRVKDIGFMHTLPKEEVRTLAGFFGLSDILFELPPGEETTLSFDCPVPLDTNILLVGPHMHEQGTHFKTSLIQGEKTSDILDLAWSSEYRDSPPVATYDVAAPLAVKKGDVLHTECVFNNTTLETLKFPKEMCATYGYYFPAPIGQDEFLCAAVHL